MSDRLISAFIGNSPIHLEGEGSGAEASKKTLWKVVLRTGEWKLRPGAGGVKLNAPLKIYRDKAPAGQISMKSLVDNFNDGAKENVTIPVVHADGTSSDSGFVRKLVIQDVGGENGDGEKQSLLWAEMDITDSEIRRKVEEKSLVGVSGGILFDYERTEDAKKFDQILSHVMVTNSPWINGTGGFVDKLPENVMASESADLPMGEIEFDPGDPDPQPHLPTVTFDDHPVQNEDAVVWKPENGYRKAQVKVATALSTQRQELMSSFASAQRYELDWPDFRVIDVHLQSGGGKALVSSGYDSEADAWVAGFKYDDKGEVELEPFVDWSPAKQEWVSASEDKQPTTKPLVRPASRGSAAKRAVSPPAPLLSDLGLQDAQAARAERMRAGTPPTPTGGTMGRLLDSLSGVDLSDEQRELLQAEESRIARLEADETSRRERDRQTQVTAYCGTPDGQTKGLLDQLGLSDPGIKKYVRNALLSDDGGPAIELSEHLGDGQKTAGVPRTATELLKGFIDILPKAEDGRVALAEQARRLPDDPKPPETNEKPPEDPQANADALLAEFASHGFGNDLIPAKGA